MVTPKFCEESYLRLFRGKLFREPFTNCTNRVKHLVEFTANDAFDPSEDLKAHFRYMCEECTARSVKVGSIVHPL